MRRSFLLLLALGLQLVAQPTQPSKPLRVLFVGNSYTFFNNLPNLLEQIAKGQANGPHIETDVSLSGGKTLQWHWEQGKAQEAVRKGGWDFVVLQEQSLLGKTVPRGETPSVNGPDLYLEYAGKFAEEIRKVGARTVLYATWARDGYPEQQRKLDDAFTQAAQKLDAILVPAGLAWTVTRIEAPSIRLHMPDRSHPTMAGSYLNALLFYQCLTGRTASNPPAVITGPKWNDKQEVTLVNLPWSEATVLNQISQRVAVQEPLCPVQ